MLFTSASNSNTARLSAGILATLALNTVSAAPQQAYTITNSAGEVLTFLPTTTVGVDTPGLVTVPVGPPILGPSTNDEGTMIVTLPVEPTDASGSTVFPPVSIPPVSMPTVVDTPTLSGTGTPSVSFDVPPVPMPTIVTTSSSPSSSGGAGGGSGSTGSTSAPPPSSSTVVPGAAPRVTGVVGLAVSGLAAAVAGVLFL